MYDDNIPNESIEIITDNTNNNINNKIDNNEPIQCHNLCFYLFECVAKCIFIFCRGF